MVTQSIAPRLTVPRTYMSASGVQSEIATKTLAKVARHEASYRTEVNKYRHDLENQFRAIKREELVLRQGQNEYSHKLSEESSLDDKGKVKMPLFRRKLRRQLTNRNPKLEALRKRNLRTREKENGKMKTFFKKVKEKIQKDEEDVEYKEEDDEEGDEGNIHRGSRLRKHRHFVRFSIESLREETFSPLSEAGVALDSETESEDEEERHKRDGGIPKVDINRYPKEFLYGHIDDDAASGGDTKNRKDGKRRAALPEKPTFETKKQEHEAKVQQVSKRYVQFLARNAEANKEKAAAQSVAALPESFQDVSSLLQTQTRGNRRLNFNLETEDEANLVAEIDDLGLNASSREGQKTIGLRRKQVSFMQLVRLQQSSGISSNLNLIDRLLHRVRRNRVGSLPKLEEDDEPDGGDYRQTVDSQTLADDTGTHRMEKKIEAITGMTKNRKAKKKLKSNKRKPPATPTIQGDKPLQPSVGFPRRISHFRRWSYYAAAPGVMASQGRFEDTPRLNMDDVLQYDQQYSHLHGMGLSPLLAGTPRRRETPPQEVPLHQGPLTVSGLKVTGQGIAPYSGTVDAYIDKKLRREKLDSAKKMQAMIWREALAQIRQVHYLSASYN